MAKGKEQQQTIGEPSAPLLTAETTTVLGQSTRGILAHYSALPASEGAPIATTMDLTQPGAFIALQNMLAGAGVSLWDIPPDQIISVRDVTAHYAQRIDEETGELVEGPMLTLSGGDGVYHTGSQYAFRALQLIGMLKGPPPWQPPIRIRAIRVRSRNKRDFQSILLVE